MYLFFAALAWSGIIAFLLLRAVRQFGSYEAIGAETELRGGEAPRLSVVVPARNEARSIERCLRGLMAQDYPPDRLKIVVVDDSSTDDTAAIVRRVAGSDPRVKLVEAEPLPAGWYGKPHACWEGAAAAQSEWLCFIDADTAAEPPLLISAVCVACRRGIEMLSLEPFQELGSFWERLLMPCGFLLLAFVQDIRRLNDPAGPGAAANGQFILIRRRVYEAVGGHAVVRAEITEDTALARLVKGSRYRVALLGAETLVRTRMYTGLRSLWQGISKNFVVMTGGVWRAVLIMLAAPWLGAAAVVLPVWTLIALASPSAGAMASPSPASTVAAAVLAWAGSLALLATHVGTARHFRIPAGYGLLAPVGYALGGVLAFWSVVTWSRGSVAWKGRVYAAGCRAVGGMRGCHASPPPSGSGLDRHHGS